MNARWIGGAKALAEPLDSSHGAMSDANFLQVALRDAGELILDSLPGLVVDHGDFVDDEHHHADEPFDGGVFGLAGIHFALQLDVELEEVMRGARLDARAGHIDARRRYASRCARLCV